MGCLFEQKALLTETHKWCLDLRPLGEGPSIFSGIDRTLTWSPSRHLMILERHGREAVGLSQREIVGLHDREVGSSAEYDKTVNDASKFLI